MTLKTPHGEFQNDWHFGFYKDMPLEKAGIEVKVKGEGEGGKVKGRGEGVKVVLSSDRPAFFVWANVRGVSGEFSDNSFTLLPGRPKTLTFNAKCDNLTEDGFRRAFSVAHLRELFSGKKD
jgi:beta-mannosidase